MAQRTLKYTCSPARDAIKFLRSEDWNAGQRENVRLSNANTIKRLILVLELTVTTGASYVPADMPDGILPALARLEIETPNEDRLLLTTFSHLWHATNINRGGIQFPSLELAADTADQTVTVMVEVDFSAYQDLGLDAGQLDQLTMYIEWVAAAHFGTNVTITAGNLKIWYDERFPSKRVYINPFIQGFYQDITLTTITEARFELPRGRRISRMYLRLYDGETPKKWLASDLTRLQVAYDNNVVWGAFNGYEAVQLWHLFHGFETSGWNDQILQALTNAADRPYDLSYIVIDPIDVLNGQLSHAFDTGVTDMFDLIYSFDATGYTNPKMRLFVEYYTPFLDRLINEHSKISRELSPDVRQYIISNQGTDLRPVAIVPDSRELQYAKASRDSGDLPYSVTKNITVGRELPSGRSTPLGAAQAGNVVGVMRTR